MRSIIMPAWVVAVAMLAPLASMAASSPLLGDLAAGTHRVGFRLLDEYDSERGRPIRIYLWYPLRSSDSAKQMQFGRYAALVDEDFWPMPASGLLPNHFTVSPLSRGYPGERLSRLLATPTGASEEAPFADSKFPLIAFAQGLYYESPIAHATLCEYLASHGFVVATCPLIGTDSRYVTLTARDLETQVRDTEFVIARVGRFPIVDSERIGLIGFDLGAMSALLLAMRDSRIGALVSLDGGILYEHPSGLPRSCSDYDATRLRIPWLHATRTAATLPPEADPSIPSLFDTAVFSDRSLLLVDEVGHVDFTSFALIDGRQPLLGYWEPQADHASASYRTVCRTLLGFLDRYLTRSPEWRASQPPAPTETLAGLPITIEHRDAVPAPPTPDDLISTILRDGIEAGIEMVRLAAGEHPECDLVREETLNQIGYRFLYFWGWTDQAIQFFRLNCELYPASSNVHDSLGEAYFLKGDRESAIASYAAALKCDPENEHSAAMLRQLRDSR